MPCGAICPALCHCVKTVLPMGGVDQVGQHCSNAGPTSRMSNRRWANVSSPCKAKCSNCALFKLVPSKQETWIQCWLNVGPTSKTVDQHEANIGSKSLVCWVTAFWLAVLLGDMILYLRWIKACPTSATLTQPCSTLSQRLSGVET